MTLSTQAKSIFTSKTFYGVVLSALGVLFPHFYEHLITAVGITDPGTIADKIVMLIGSAFAIYGRFTATQPVTLTGK